MTNFTKSSIAKIVINTIPEFCMRSYKITEFGGTVYIKIELALWIMLVPLLWFLWWWYRRQIIKNVENVRPAGVRVVVVVE